MQFDKGQLRPLVVVPRDADWLPRVVVLLPARELAGVVLPPRVAGVAVVLPLRVAVVVPRCVVLEVRVAGVETFLSS